MKRHKYVFPSLTNKITKSQEIGILVRKYILNLPNISPSIKHKCTKYLAKKHIPISKIHSYCLVTGRVRSPITFAHVSRHIFFNYTSWGFMTGFFYGSKS
jgi:hypothetical protein